MILSLVPASGQKLFQIVFSVWVSFRERKWVTLAERRGRMPTMNCADRSGGARRSVCRRPSALRFSSGSRRFTRPNWDGADTERVRARPPKADVPFLRNRDRGKNERKPIKSAIRPSVWRPSIPVMPVVLKRPTGADRQRSACMCLCPANIGDVRRKHIHTRKGIRESSTGVKVVGSDQTIQLG
jgi:hypothetical protein